MVELVAAALLPVLAYLYIVYRVDRFDKEPKRLLMKLFVMGGISVIPIIVVELILNRMNVFDSDLKNLYRALIVAGFTEELFKWLIVKKYAYHDRAYNERLDGIIYSVYVSLGFAAVENIMYVLSNGNMTIAVTRAITALPGHMLFGVVMGYYLSRQKFAKNGIEYRISGIKSLLVPIALHGAYDYILMTKYKGLLIAFVPYLIGLWFFGVRKIRTYYILSKNHHE